jgi:hypothetical protein
MSRSEIRPQVAAARIKVAAMQNVMNSHRRMRTTENQVLRAPQRLPLCDRNRTDARAGSMRLKVAFVDQDAFQGTGAS